MRSSKDRTIEKKRRNKAIRDEIHAIDPDAKVDIKNQRPYINGKPVKVVDNEIKSILIL